MSAGKAGRTDGRTDGSRIMAMKEVRAVLADLDRRMTDGEAARAAAEQLRAVYGLTVGAMAGKRTGPRAKRGAPADGSLGDRILGILRETGEPVAKKAIVASAGARELDVILTIKELIVDGQIKKQGVRAGTKYSLAKKGGTK